MKIQVKGLLNEQYLVCFKADMKVETSRYKLAQDVKEFYKHWNVFKYI